MTRCKLSSAQQGIICRGCAAITSQRTGYPRATAKNPHLSPNLRLHLGLLAGLGHFDYAKRLCKEYCLRPNQQSPEAGPAYSPQLKWPRNLH
jgi:hypothetical protein